MKVKTETPKVNSLDRICDQLYHLGFGGGEMKKTASMLKPPMRSLLFRLSKRSDLVLVKDKKGQRGMRMRSEPEFELEVQYYTKKGDVIWGYATSAQEKTAKGTSGMHLKLSKIFGVSNS